MSTQEKVGIDPRNAEALTPSKFPGRLDESWVPGFQDEAHTRAPDDLICSLKGVLAGPFVPDCVEEPHEASGPVRGGLVW